LSETCVRAQALSKRFLVLTSRKSTLRALRAWFSGGSVKREHWVLRDLTFQLEKGEKLALIGRNGSGKTTLLRLLTGIYEKSSGSLAVRGRPSALFDCSVGFHRDLPVVDNIYLFGALYGMSRPTLAPREQAVLRLAELEQLAHVPLKALSMGQIRRLGLSVFSQTTSGFLVLDEVLANADHGFRRKSERFFEAFADSDKTIIMASHDGSFLGRYCTRAIWLDDGRVRRDGPVDEVLEEYERTYDEEPADLLPPGWHPRGRR